MKTLVIGDIHGKDVWKGIVNLPHDKIVFVGDYFDSFDIPFQKQYQNFLAILEFKKANPDKVVLLVGNHDYHYLGYSPEDRYSGYQEVYAGPIGELLRDAVSKGQLQMCTVEEGGVLISHAGVTKTWCEFAHIDLNNLEGSINKCFMFTPQMFKFMKYQGADGTGDNVYQSPIWVRPKSLCSDKIPDTTQVVGHTKFKEIISNNDIIFVDVLDSTNEYLELEDGKIISVNVIS